MPDQEPPTDGDPQPSASATEVVADRLAELVTTTLELGATVAHSVAASTTTRDLPPRGDAPLDDIVTFGVAAAGNLVDRAMDVARTAVRFVGKTSASPSPASGRPGFATESAAESARPRVTCGSVLRMPLLVENTGPTPTTELSFQATEVNRVTGGADDQGIAVDQVTFTPPTLVIGQRDFEKLTVRIHTVETTAPGTYQATIAGGDGWFTTTIEFEVVQPAP